MDFNKLKTFITVVDSGSVSNGARLLFRTQSAISQQIQVLESELEISLFESLRGSLLLTEEGRQIYENVTQHFQAIESTVHKSQQILQELNGTIRIGTSPSIGHYFLPNIISKFKSTNNKVNFEVVLLPDEQNESLLRRDKIDLGLIINFESRKLFSAKTLISFDEHLVCSRKYLNFVQKKNKRGLDKYSDLADIDFVDFDSSAPNITHWLKKNSPNYRAILSNHSSTIALEDNECIKRMVLKNLGVAMLPQYMITDELKSEKLVLLFPKSKPTKVSVDLATRKKKNTSLCLSEFLKTLENIKFDMHAL